MEYTIGTKVFGDWEIVKEIGEGSYGKVFELHKSNFGVQAKSALKLIRIPKSVSEIREALSEGMDEKTVTHYFEGIVQQFVKEIAVMTELKSHANIVSCEDYVVKEHEGTIGWDILIRMELLTSLQEYLIQHPVTEEIAKKLAVDMCEALVFCQKKGLIHRDIKPGNIFVDDMGRFKLGDFGVARTAEKTMGGLSKQGTENYMAPEVYYVRPYGASVDIYSLGMVLYRLMNSNRLPFYPPAPAPIRLSDRENALKRRMEGEQLPPCNGSEEFVRIILKACEADPNKRFRTAGEMLAALTGSVSSSGLKSRGDILEENAGHFREEHSPFRELNLDDDDGTVNPFDDRKRDINETAKPDDEEDDGTINPFGDTPKPGMIKPLKFTRENEPIGKTRDIHVDGKNNISAGEKGDLLSTFEPEAVGFSGKGTSENKEDSKEFWRTMLPRMWSDKKMSKWIAYYAPYIPLQIYSNAIFNIGENEVKKSEIIAILDTTPDTRIPCGGGIIVTKDKMILQLGAMELMAKTPPKAVIHLDEIEDAWCEETKKMLAKWSILWWRTKDGRLHKYDSPMNRYVSFKAIAETLNSLCNGSAQDCCDAVMKAKNICKI